MHRVLVVAVVLALVAGACSLSGDPAGEVDPARPGVLVVATSLPAQGFWDGASVDELEGGFEYGIVLALADRFDLRLEVIDLPFDRIVAGDLGGADMALAQISVTSGREDVLDFSTPYERADAGVLVVGGTEVRDLAQARDRRWVVERSTTEADFVADVIRPDQETLVTGTRAETLDALRTGRADAALLDLPIALAEAHDPGSPFTVAGQFLTGQSFAVALPRGSGNTEAVDSAIRAFAADGTLDELSDRYLVPVMGRDPANVPSIQARS